MYLLKGLKVVGRKQFKKLLRVMGYDVPQMSYYNISRALYFKRMLELVSEVRGDIVECGIHRGTSFSLWASLVKEEMKGRKLWGFDSFEGFPDLSENDKSMEGRQAKKGDYSDTSIATISSLLLHMGLGMDFIESHITIVKGFFHESLSKYRGSSIALLHLDIDLYESYQTVLKQLYPKVAKGGILLFDEYINTLDLKLYPGAQRAIDEFFGERKSLMHRDTVTGKYYLIKQEP